MARKDRMRNLALLGGLGAAAMMMGKGEKKTETKAEAKPSAKADEGPQTYADMPEGEEVVDETGAKSGFRRNPESGDLYRSIGARPKRNTDAGYSNLFKKGGKVKKYAAGGSASKRADGCATKGKTRGKMV